MISMKKIFSDLISGLILTAFSLVFLHGTKYIRIQQSTLVSAATMPRICGGALLIFALVLTGQGIISMLKPPSISSVTESKKKKKTRSWAVVVSFLLLLLFAFGMYTIGFVLSASLYPFGHFVLLAPPDRRNYTLFAVIATAFSAGIYGLFVNVFYLMLPAGTLWG